MKKKDIVAKALDTVNKLVQAEGIPHDICDDFRVCIAMIQDINRIEFITVKREFSIDKKDMDKVLADVEELKDKIRETKIANGHGGQ